MSKIQDPSIGILRPHPKALRGSTKNEPINKDQKQEVFERDNHSCCFCGFTSKRYQDIHYKDLNIHNHSSSNLVTACMFCAQCFNLESVSDMKSGVLIWMPEISQIELNHIARAIYVARISQGPVAEAARLALDVIMGRREEAKKRLSTDDPSIVSMVMRDYLGYGHFEKRVEKLSGIRLFPLDRRLVKEAELEFNQFPQILAYWRSKDGPFGGKTPQKWPDLFAEALVS